MKFLFFLSRKWIESPFIITMTIFIKSQNYSRSHNWLFILSSCVLLLNNWSKNNLKNRLHKMWRFQNIGFIYVYIYLFGVEHVDIHERQNTFCSTIWLESPTLADHRRVGIHRNHKALKIRATHMTLYATMTYNQFPIYDATDFLATCLTTV